MVEKFISVSQLKFAKVVSSKGREIGSIDDIVIHQETQNVAYVVLKMRGLMGFGDKRIPVPLGAFHTKDKEPKTIILDVDRKTLKKAPMIEPEELFTFDFKTYLNKIYDYYSVDFPEHQFGDKSKIRLSNTQRKTLTRIRKARQNLKDS